MAAVRTTTKEAMLRHSLNMLCPEALGLEALEALCPEALVTLEELYTEGQSRGRGLSATR